MKLCCLELNKERQRRLLCFNRKVAWKRLVLGPAFVQQRQCQHAKPAGPWSEMPQVGFYSYLMKQFRKSDGQKKNPNNKTNKPTKTKTTKPTKPQTTNSVKKTLTKNEETPVVWRYPGCLVKAVAFGWVEEGSPGANCSGYSQGTELCGQGPRGFLCFNARCSTMRS